MIFYYKHKNWQDNMSFDEINMLGYEGVFKFAQQYNLDPSELFYTIKKLEHEIQLLSEPSFDFDDPKCLKLLNTWENQYIDYFNNNAQHNKQAYVLLGNIASGKSTFAKKLEEETHSIIVDSDRFKMGEETPQGFFEGFSSLYQKPTDRERMQEICASASKRTVKTVADLGMNLILPKATTSYEKLSKQLEYLFKNNYDIHLYLFETPIKECANRNYYRYLIKEYEREYNKQNIGGRFVPVSVITNIGDNTYETFVKAFNGKRFSSYKAFYNDKYTSNEEIDLETMQM